MQTQLEATGEDWTAGSLAAQMPSFLPETTCGRAFDYFHANRDQVAAAIVDADGHVLGIVNRLRFLARYAQPYVPELYSRRSIVELANRSPLVVDAEMPMVGLSNMLTYDWPDALRECFVIARNGRYYGIGTSEAIVRAKLSMLMARESQLHGALQEAEAASKAKGNFLALMSHELRTPLNAIIGFSEVLSMELLGPHQVSRYREYSADIHNAGSHLLALINDILDLSKAEAGKLELYPEPLDIAQLFADCLRFVNERARQQKIKIHTALDADIPRLMADRLRMKQVLLNLLSNAVKFTLPGGHVTLSAVRNDDGALVIGVADTGIGMAPEAIPVALEAFRQIDSPMSRKVEGTGLGLSLAKSLVEGHGGAIRIESAVNVGTTVTIVMPPSRSVRPAGAACSRDLQLVAGR